MPFPPARFSPWRAAALGAWFGIIAGVSEGCLVAARKVLLGRFVWAGVDIAWMLPVGQMVLFAAAALILCGAAGLLRRSLQHGDLAGFLSALAAFSLLLQYGPLHRVAGGILAIGFGVLVARLWRQHPAVFERVCSRTTGPLVALTALLVAGAFAWRRLAERAGPAGQPTAGSPNVLLLVLDTVRSLDLSAYGYARETTPELRRFAAHGVRFAHATSTAPWTLPSHASIFTGRWSAELSANWSRPLDGTYPTLAERLSAVGYRTAGFVANTHYCSKETGLSRGFQHYEDYPISVIQTLFSAMLGKVLAGGHANQRLRLSADDINQRLLRWLDRPASRPFFAFVNYLDAHDPYDPPAPYAGRYSGSARVSWVEMEKGMTGSTGWPDSVIRLARDAYDESIAYLDSRIGHLLGALETRGLLDNTIVIIASDHGEEFGEHGVIFHGNSLYRPAIEVPLLISWRGHVPEGLVVEPPVSLRDLGSTILDLVGQRAPFPGKSVARFWAGSGAADSDTLFASVRYQPGLPSATPVSRGSMTSAIAGGMRVIRNGDGSVEVYDFRSDPEERHDLMKSPETREAAVRSATILSGRRPGRGPIE